MPHILMPTDDQSFLAVDDLAARITAAFRQTEISREQGEEHIRDVMQELLDLRDTGIAVPEDELDKLRHALDQALYVTIYDDEADLQDGNAREVDFAIVPDDGIIIGYDDEEHEKAVYDLVERLAQATGYRIDEV